MNVTECVASVRLGALIKDAHPDYTDARIRTELWDTQMRLFGAEIVGLRSGYWLQRQTYQCVGGERWVRAPKRALAVELIEIQRGAAWSPLLEISAQAAGITSQSTGNPTRYMWRDDGFELYPAPVGGELVRVTYYRRPGAFYAAQTAGEITACTSTTVTVNSLPTRSGGSAIATGDLVDIVRPSGSFGVVVASGYATVSGSVITFTTGYGEDGYSYGSDLSGVEKTQGNMKGDFVRYQGETDWPSIPDGFHRALCSATGAVIANEMQVYTIAQQLGSLASGDVQRFKALVTPRNKTANVSMVPREGVLRRSVRGTGGRLG